MSEIILPLGAVEPEDTTLWGWDNDTSVAMATGSPTIRRQRFECEDGTILTLGLLSLTYDQPLIQSAEGVFTPAGGAKYPVADEFVVTIVNPGLREIEGIRPRVNFRKSRR